MQRSEEGKGGRGAGAGEKRRGEDGKGRGGEGRGGECGHTARDSFMTELRKVC